MRDLAGKVAFITGGGNHRAAVDHGITHGLGFVTQAGFYPQGFQAKRRVFCGDPVESAKYLPGIDGHFFAGVDF